VRSPYFAREFAVRALHHSRDTLVNECIRDLAELRLSVDEVDVLRSRLHGMDQQFVTTIKSKQYDFE
jgi:hypothetical protein